MKSIENTVNKNREAFNDADPSPDHLNNFKDKLDAFHEQKSESWIRRNGEMLRIAAVIVLFITVGTVYLTGGFSFVRDAISEQIVAAELPLEIQEVMQYYNVISDKKLDQIDELAVSEDEAKRIKEMAILELTQLEDARLELEKEYQKSPENERIMNALLMNQQKRSELLDKILNTLNQVK